MGAIDKPGPIATRFAENMRTLDLGTDDLAHRVANLTRGLMTHLTVALGELERDNALLRQRVDALEQRLG